MAAKKIGAIIALDGEREFKQNVTSCNKALSALTSEMNLVKAECEGQQNTLESLTKKHNVLTKILDEHKKKEAEVQKGLDHAKESYDKVREGLTKLSESQEKHTRKIEELKGEYRSATERLEEMEKAGDSSGEAFREQEAIFASLSEELEKEEAALKEVNEAIAKGERNSRTAGERIQEWEKKLNDAKTEVIKTSSELEENARYMDEARRSTDGCTHSIDEFGNKVEEAEEVTVNFGTIVKANLCNTVVEALKDMAKSAVVSIQSMESAQRQFQASTGATTAEMRSYKSVMEDLHASNYGEDINDVAQSMALVRQYTGELDASKIKDMTENGIAMRDVFGIDLSETIRGVDAIVDNMGITSEEAFDLMARGAQSGLNKSGELADNIAEYGSLWSQAGFSAREMFAIMENGLDSGAYNLDKVNDFVKEFGNSLVDGRIEDGIDSFSDSTKTLFYQWKSGKATTKDVFYSVINDLSSAANKQEMLTVASNTWSALGEDNALKVITSLNKVNTSYDNVKGTMEEIKEIKYDTLESRFENLGKKFQTEVAAPIAEKALPAIETGLDLVIENMDVLVPVMAGVAAGAAAFKTASAAVVLYTAYTEGATTATALFNAVCDANPVVFLAAAAVAAGTALMVYAGSAGEASKEVQMLAESNQKVCDTANEVAESTKGLIADYGNTTAEMQAQGEYTQILADKIAGLAGKKKLDNAETQVMQEYIAELNSLVPGLNLAYDEQSKSLNLTNEAIEEYLNNSQKQIEMQAAQEYAVELIKKKTALEIESIKIENEASTLREKTNELIGTRNEKEAASMDLKEKLCGLSWDERRSYDELTEAQRDNNAALEENKAMKDDLKAQIEASAEQLEQYGIKWSEVTDKTNENTESTNTNAQAQAVAADANSIAVQTMAETYMGMQETVAGVLESQMNMFEEFDAGTKISSEKLLANMQTQIEGVTNWADNMAQLADRGVNQGILDKLAEMGPQGSSYVQAFAGMTDEQLKQANEMWSQSLDMKAGVNASVQGMIEEYTVSLSGGRETVNVLMQEVGADSVRGLVEGVNQAKEQAGTAGQDIGKTITTGTKTSLNSHSPSKVFEGIGRDVVSGLTGGVRGSQGQAVSAVQELTKLMVNASKRILNVSDFTGIGRNITTGVQRGVQSGTPSVVNMVSSMGKNARGRIQEELRADRFTTIGRNVSQGLASGIASGTHQVRSSAGSMIQAVTSEGRSLGRYTLYTEGFNVSIGLANGILAGRSSVINAVASVCAATVREARSDLGIHSPSKVFEELGGYTAEGFGVGYEKKMSDVNRVIRDSMEIPDLGGRSDGRRNGDHGGVGNVSIELPVYINGIYTKKEVAKFTMKEINKDQKYKMKGTRVNIRQFT